MANIFDVAEFILNDLDTSSTMKLQKIIFYSHAYHLVHYGSPLVNSRVEAWANERGCLDTPCVAGVSF